MILHLVSDHFVTNSCLRIFKEKLPGQNIVLVFEKFGYKVEDGTVVNKQNRKSIAESIDFSQIKFVVVSFQTRSKIKFLKEFVPDNIPVIWWTYGIDFYASFLYLRGFSLFYSDPDKYRIGGVLSYPLIKILRLFANIRFRDLQKTLVDRLVAFVPCIKPEYSLLCKYIDKKIDLLQVHSYGSSFHFGGRFAEGNDIAIGHSASISDNHLYALEYLERFDLKESDIYITLSYSNTLPKYTRKVDRCFKRRYKEKVHLIYEMVPKTEYFESLFRYKMVILASWRQEALDNIYTCLQIGIKLVLSDKSIVYAYLKEYGFRIYSLESLTQEDVDTPLSLQDRIHNQKLFELFVSERKNNYHEDFDRFFLND